MKGVVLAGGLGTRFDPVTRVVNKHLLDVFDEPMIYFPIRSLAHAGITDLVLVAGKELAQFQYLLGNGSELGVQLSYAQQEGEMGIAHALARAEALVGGERMVVILGDNIYQEDLTEHVRAYVDGSEGAKVLLRRGTLEDSKRFGVARLDGERIVEIVEKPDDPPSNLVVTGTYMLDERAFDIIPTLTPSDRGEYEISDVLNHYAARDELGFGLLQGWWTDAGTPASKLKASILVALNKGVTFHG